MLLIAYLGGEILTSPLRSLKAGMGFQSLQFWRQAVKLLGENSNVSKVRAEIREDGVKGFDDIYVEYNEPLYDASLKQHIKGDYHQIKFKLDYSGTVSFETLMDKNFSGSSKSLLIKLRDTVFSKELQTRGCFRFFIHSPWQLDTEFGGIVSVIDGKINIKRLQSAHYKELRKKLTKHLSLKEKDLYTLLDYLIIKVTTDYRDVEEIVNLEFKSNGLKTDELEKWSDRKYQSLYDNIERYHSLSLTKDTLMEILIEEDMLLSKLTIESHPYKLEILRKINEFIILTGEIHGLVAIGRMEKLPPVGIYEENALELHALTSTPRHPKKEYIVDTIWNIAKGITWNYYVHGDSYVQRQQLMDDLNHKFLQELHALRRTIEET